MIIKGDFHTAEIRDRRCQILDQLLDLLQSSLRKFNLDVDLARELVQQLQALDDVEERSEGKDPGQRINVVLDPIDGLPIEVSSDIIRTGKAATLKRQSKKAS